MKFRVGRFTCEMSLDDSGKVQTRWYPEPPKYLNKEERMQWQAGLTTFLSSLVKDDPRPAAGANRSTTLVKNLLCLIMAAGLLAGCARGGGIGLEAIVADGLCEQRGFRLGTPNYANRRAQIAYQRDMVNAEMQARLQRQQAELMAQMNRQQMRSYNGQTIYG